MQYINIILIITVIFLSHLERCVVARNFINHREDFEEYIYKVVSRNYDEKIKQELLEDSERRAWNWMKYLPDHIQLSQIAIPGTHDTAAYHTPGDLGKTQDWNTKEQLNNGIRFLDIRISDSHLSDDFELHHGFLKLGSFKRLVMDKVKMFLTNHPSETVLMAIRGQDSKLDVEKLERLFIHNPKFMFYQRKVSPHTKIKDVRGKIVLFRRYSGGHDVGLKWGHSMNIQDDYSLTLKSANTCEDVFCLPDATQVNFHKKAKTVINFFKIAVKNYGKQFHINYASAQFQGFFMKNNAQVSNKALVDYFGSHQSFKVGCIIPMDYPNEPRDTIQEIVDNNLNRKS